MLRAEITGRVEFTWSRLPGFWRFLGVAAVVALLAGVLAGGVLLVSSKDWGGKLAGIAAGIALLYAGYQVRLTRALAKQNLAYAYFERFSRYSLKQPYAEAKGFTFPHPRGEDDALARWEQFKHWGREEPGKVRDLIFIFNFFEELGGLYQLGAVDRRIVNDFLGKFALQFREALDWFIPLIRDDRSPTLFEDWGAMSATVKRELARKERLR